MVLSGVWVTFVVISFVFTIFYGRGAAVSTAALDGARLGIELTFTIAGPICLWSGAGKLMETLGLTKSLSKFMSPLLSRLYPSSKEDPFLAGALSANVCANLLGLGNAATPMGIQAVKRLTDPARPGVATDEMCRLVVMNTASIQLIPTTVAAVRASAGSAAPFDILPCVWTASVLSVCAGLLAAWCMGRVMADG